KLDEELRHMRNYIFIQENRFYGRCQVGMDVDEQVLASQLPRFTLQPIVENAFEYGLQPKRGSWHLFIRMKRIRNRCVFIVVDQGIGIVPERLEEIRDRLKGRITLNAGQQQSAGTGRRKGVGLHNVNARMVLQFGDKHRMRVFSKAGEGTMIVISWPYVNTGEELGGNAESVDRG
ncbi:sensor histidine kinase, partial [Paenibacillus sp. MCAF20]